MRRQEEEGGAVLRREPLTHSFKQRATASLLGNCVAQTNPARGGGRLALELRTSGAGGGPRREERREGRGRGPGRGAGHNACTEAKPPQPHPAAALLGVPPPQGLCLLGTLHVTR